MFDESTSFYGSTDAQSVLIQHWMSCCSMGALPTRAQLDPGAIRAQLSAISMIEILADGCARFRLAGSGLRQLFGCEMRGRTLEELDHETSEMWSLGLARVLEEVRPIAGQIRREHDTHVWLRLPLRSEKQGALILCHDEIIPNQRLVNQYSGKSCNNQYSINNIAA